MHHQAATYLAKQLTFSMGTGDSLELSVTGAPADSATRPGGWPDDLVRIPGRSYPSGHESNDKPGRNQILNSFFNTFSKLFWAKVARINRLLISPSIPKTRA